MSDDCGLLPKVIISLAREITIYCDRQAPPQSLWVMYHSEVFRVVGLGCTYGAIVFNLFPARLLLMKIPSHRQSECHGGEGAGRGISYPRIVSEVDYLQVHFRIDV
ncbi:hypothetical protein BDR07DRAFT_1421067 [Suillus spraguei]|nr:hypothetical protein BDR07DRAFT_1421067 [Suillus spraguei]